MFNGEIKDLAQQGTDQNGIIAIADQTELTDKDIKTSNLEQNIPATNVIAEIIERAQILVKGWGCEGHFHVDKNIFDQFLTGEAQLKYLLELLKEAWKKAYEEGYPNFEIDEQERDIQLEQFNSISKEKLNNIIDNAEIKIDTQKIDFALQQFNTQIDLLNATTAIGAIPSKNPIDYSQLDSLLFFQTFEKLAQTNPDQIALIFDESLVSGSATTVVNWTYGELNKYANKIANHLIELKQKNQWTVETCVLLFFENSPEAVASILGVMKSGLAYVPLTPSKKLKPTHLNYYINTAAPKLVLVQEKLINHDYVQFIHTRLPELSVTNYQEFVQQNQNINNPNLSIDKNQLAYIIFSSGSTGAPKAIKIAHRGLPFSIIAIKEIFDIKPNDKIGWYSLLTFDASLVDIMTALATGATLVVIPEQIRTQYETLALYIKSHSISIITLVASVLRQLNPDDLPGLRGYISTGERAYAETFNKWSKRIGVNGYGPTEVSAVTSVTRYDMAEGIHIGFYPIPGLQWFVFEKSSENDPYPAAPKLLPEGIEGELYIAGEGLGLGYVDETAHYQQRYREIPNPYKPEQKLRIYQTGDAVTWSNGKMYFNGRIDRQHKYLGELIELEAIEKAIENYQEADRKFFKTVKVKIETQDGEEYSLPILRAYLEEAIPGIVEQKIITKLHFYLQNQSFCTVTPSRFSLLKEKWPLNENGKIALDKLITLPKEDFYPSDIFALKPKSKGISKEITRIWSEVLNIPENKFFIDTSFYELGGDSLRTNQLLAAVEKRYKFYKKDFKKFNNCPTIRAMAFQVETAEKKQYHQVDYVGVNDFREELKNNKNPIILINSVTGDSAVDYQHVIPYLNDQPLFLLKAVSLSKNGYVVDSLEQLAEDYIESINQKINELNSPGNYTGPLLLIGYSAGGSLAYAIAEKLQKIGREVAICCIDTPSVLAYQKLTQARYAEEIKNLTKHTVMALGKDPKVVDDISDLKLESYPKSKQLLVMWHKLIATLDSTDADKRKYHKVVTTLYNMIQPQLSYQLRAIKGVTLLAFTESVLKFDDNRLGWSEAIALNHIALSAEHLYVVKQPLWVENTLIPHLKNFYNTAIKNMRFAAEVELLKKEYNTGLNEILNIEWETPALSIEQGFINLKLVNAKVENEILDIGNIFSVDNNFTKKILITGEPGSGKSTLCQFIANQWAQEKIYGEFDVVVWVKLDELNKKNINKIINVRKFTELSKKVLLLLDGYDELNVDNQYADKIHAAIKDTNCAVILTSRTFANKPKLLPEFDKYIESAGFDETAVKKYINNFGASGNNSLVGQLQSILELNQDKNLIYFFSNPLYLSLCCKYWQQHSARYEFADLMAFIIKESWDQYPFKIKKANKDVEQLSFYQNIENILELIAVDAFLTGQLKEKNVDTIISTWNNTQSKVVNASHLKISKRDLLVSNLIFLTGSKKNEEFKFFHPEAIEFFTVKHLEKKLAQNDFVERDQFSKLIRKYPNLYSIVSNNEGNKHLSALLNTDVIKNLGVNDKNAIIDCISQAGITNPIEKSSLYKIISNKVDDIGMKKITQELKKIDEDYSFKSILKQIYKYKPDNNILLYLKKPVEFFQNKILSLSDPDSLHNLNKEIIEVKSTQYKVAFTLEDNSILNLHLSHSGKVHQASIIKPIKYQLLMYLMKLHYIQQGTVTPPIVEIRNNSQLKEFGLKVGKYNLTSESYQEIKKTIKQKAATYAYEIASDSDFSNQNFVRVFNLKRENTIEYVIRVFENIQNNTFDENQNNFATTISKIEIIEYKTQKSNVIFDKSVFRDTYVEFTSEQIIKGITSENVRNKIRLREKDKNDTKENLRKKSVIEQYRESIIEALQNPDNKHYLDNLLEELHKNKLTTISSEKLISVNVVELGSMREKLNQIVAVYKEIGEFFSVNEILTKIVLEAVYKRYIVKKDNLVVYEAMQLLKMAFEHTKVMQGKNMIWYYGNTGAGKSTCVNHVIGVELEEIVNDYGLKFVKIKEGQMLDPNSHPRIGQSIGSSETIYMQGYKIFKKVGKVSDNFFEHTLVVDCAGINDTRGTKYELCSMLSIDQAISKANSIKAIVLTIPCDAFLIDRGNLIFELFENLKERIPELYNNSAILESIFLVVTKHHAYTDPNKFIDNTIQQYREDVISKLNEQTYRGREEREPLLARKIMWDTLREMYDFNRVKCIDVEDDYERAKLIRKFAKTPGIDKKFYKQAIESEISFLGRYLHESIHTWQELIMKPYLVSIPSTIEDIRDSIQRDKLDFEEIEKENKKHESDISKLNELIKKAQENKKALEMLDQNINFQVENETVKLLTVASQDLREQRSAELVKAKKGITDAIEKNKDKLKNLGLTINMSSQAYTDFKNSMKIFVEVLNDLQDGGFVAKKLQEKSFSLSPDNNGDITLWYYKNQTLRERLDKVEELKNEDIDRIEKKKASECLNTTFFYHAYIKQNFKVVPSDTVSRETFIATGNYDNKYIATIKTTGNIYPDPNHKPRVAEDKERDGKNMIYPYLYDYSKGPCSLIIEHILPKEVVFEADINNKMAEKQKVINEFCESLENEVGPLNPVPNPKNSSYVDQLIQVKLNSVNQKIDKVIKKIATQQEQIDEYQSEIRKIETEVIANSKQKLIEEYAEAISSYSQKVVDLKKNINDNNNSKQQLVEGIKAKLENLKEPKAKKWHFAMIIKNQLDIAKVLREFAVLAINDKLGIDMNAFKYKEAEHSSLYNECVSYIKYYDQNIKKLKQEIEKDLFGELTIETLDDIFSDKDKPDLDSSNPQNTKPVADDKPVPTSDDTEKKPPVYILRSIQTLGDGSCAFHALLGKVEANKTCQVDKTTEKRIALRDKILNAKPEDPVYQYILEGIKLTILPNGRDFSKKLYLSILKKGYELFENDKDTQAIAIWSDIKNYCDYSEVIKQKINIQDDKKFKEEFTRLMADDKTFEHEIFNNPNLKEKYNQLLAIIKKEFPWSERVTVDTINEYAELIGGTLDNPSNEYLFTAEFGILAYTFNIKVETYTKDPKTNIFVEGAKYEPQTATETVKVAHNGINHFERLITEEQLPSPNIENLAKSLMAGLQNPETKIQLTDLPKPQDLAAETFKLGH